jgi:hypothetical protein
MGPEYWRHLLRPVFAGRKVIVTGTPLAGAPEQVKVLRELGAADVFALAEGIGTGKIADCAHYVLDLTSESLMGLIRAGQEALRDPPADAIAAIDAFDPERNALVVGSFLNEAASVAGRTCLAHRHPTWLALEDKVVADEIFDAAGVRRAPSHVVGIGELQWSGAEEVWAGDAREGFHGGAEQTHLVRGSADADAAHAALVKECDRVRVMPFLDGIPCAIHGMVIDGDVIALRPVEMVTLRRAEPPYFFYAGAATYWDPPDADREEMRTVAYKTGAELARRVGFRGAFTVDGVLTADGFLPTEINPRMGAGLRVVEGGIKEIPLHFLISAISGGVALDYRPSQLEALLIERADASRRGGTWRAIPTPLPGAEPRPLAWNGEGWRDAGDATPDAVLVSGKSEIGGFLRLGFEPARTPAGPSVGERAAAFYAFCDRELGTAVGPLTAAPDVRRA